MLGGKVTAGISGYGEFENQIKAGKMRALAVSSGERLPGVDVPTLKEQGMDVEVVNWRAVIAGPGITPEHRKTLADTVEKTVKSKEWAELLKARGWDDYYLPGDLRGVPESRADARRRRAEEHRPGQILRTCWRGRPSALPSLDFYPHDCHLRAGSKSTGRTWPSCAVTADRAGARSRSASPPASSITFNRRASAPAIISRRRTLLPASASRGRRSTRLSACSTSRASSCTSRNRGYFVGEAKDVAPDAIGLAEGDEVTEAYFALADDHLRGRIPGQVSESHLGERYRLTRAQLTAVLGRAAQEGWAERRAGYGWAFSPVLSTQESLEQTYRVRLALEPAALLEPGYRLDPDTADRLPQARSGFSPVPSRRTARMRCTSAACASTRRSSAPRATRSFWRPFSASTAFGACFLPVDARPDALPAALPGASEDPRSHRAREER